MEKRIITYIFLPIFILIITGCSIKGKDVINKNDIDNYIDKEINEANKAYLEELNNEYNMLKYENISLDEINDSDDLKDMIIYYIKNDASEKDILSFKKFLDEYDELINDFNKLKDKKKNYDSADSIASYFYQKYKESK